jgi:uncharacterized protein YecT (DUF1311 family)
MKYREIKNIKFYMKKLLIIFLLTIAQFYCFSQFSSDGYVEKLWKDFDIVDAKLNVQYKKTYNSLKTKSHKETLKKLQVEWIKYKETHCDEDSITSGASRIGKIEVLVGCLTEQTNDRIKFLKKYKA